MIRSMTGFARRERQGPWGALSCELRAVNHRYLELSLRLPEELRAIESSLRERVAAKVSRGKVDLGIRYRPTAAAVAHRMEGMFPRMQAEFTEVLRFPGVLEEAEFDQVGLQADALALLDATL